MTPVLSKVAPAPLILKKKTFWSKFSQHFQRKSYFSKTYSFVVKLCFSYHLFKFQAELCCFIHFSDYFGNSGFILGEEVGSLHSLTHLCQPPLYEGAAKCTYTVAPRVTSCCRQIWIESYLPTNNFLSTL